MPKLNDAQATIQLYCDLMEEIKHRHKIISAVTHDTLVQYLPPRAIEEFCYLQVRMICELIALASLVAHGDVKGTRTNRISKRYEADWIMKTMERLHPNFYPRPSRQMCDAAGGLMAVEEILSGYLTRSDLSKLYAECGNALHRGTLKTVLSRANRAVPDFNRVQDWLQKIVTLLNHHQSPRTSTSDHCGPAAARVLSF
jgi:hypothetical protein